MRAKTGQLRRLFPKNADFAYPDGFMEIPVPEADGKTGPPGQRYGQFIVHAAADYRIGA